MERIISYVASFIVILLALPVHEFAHAFAAVKAGDPTPKLEGRYTINPIKHFDLIGLIMLMVVHFGWAKPVPVNPYNFRHMRRDYFWVSIAGILSNLIMSFIFALLMVVFCTLLSAWSEPWLNGINYYGVSADVLLYNSNSILKLCMSGGTLSLFGYIGLTLVYYVLLYGILINVNLLFFNLIPVFPLDGFRILDCILKKKGKVFWFLRTKGNFVLIGLLIWSALCGYLDNSMPLFGYLDILGNALSFVNNLFFKLFTGFWGLIF